MCVYRTVVADPPWQPGLGGSWGARTDKGRPQRFYPTMPLEDIKALTVPSAPQAHLYLWCLSQHIDWGYEVARAWGFDPVITLTWCKDGLGVGDYIHVGRLAVSGTNVGPSFYSLYRVLGRERVVRRIERFLAAA